MDKEDLRKRLALFFALGAIGLGGITLVALFLAFTYSLNVWFGVCVSAILLMGIGGVTLNILEENERGY